MTGSGKQEVVIEEKVSTAGTITAFVGTLFTFTLMLELIGGVPKLAPAEIVDPFNAARVVYVIQKLWINVLPLIMLLLFPPVAPTRMNVVAPEAGRSLLLKMIHVPSEL